MEMIKDMSPRQLEQYHDDLMLKYQQFQKQKLDLNMSRGKPSPEQLSLADDMLYTVGGEKGFMSENGLDCRNYGCIDGIPEIKRLMAELMELSLEEVIIGGNSSLNIMFDTVSRAMTVGVYGSERPWCKEEKVKFLCPVPGYDRHFKVCDHFGIEMINVDMTPDGPDMDQVERYVSSDPLIKGIWCVPKYSNPTGVTFTPETVRRFANLTPAAKDFRIFWDNAYLIHDLYDEGDELLNILEELKKTGKEDMVFIFASTSKISYAGAGVAAIGASKNNIDLIREHLSAQTIGHDKVTQLMHARFFKDIDGIRKHMKKHASFLAPKFHMVEEILYRELDGLEIADWTDPKGGYFISFNTLDGCAKRVEQLCKGAGLILTTVGATFPHGIDPRDRNIRIAPSFLELETLHIAVELFTLSVKIASVEKYLGWI